MHRRLRSFPWRWLGGSEVAAHKAAELARAQAEAKAAAVGRQGLWKRLPPLSLLCFLSKFLGGLCRSARSHESQGSWSTELVSTHSLCGVASSICGQSDSLIGSMPLSNVCICAPREVRHAGPDSEDGTAPNGPVADHCYCYLDEGDREVTSATLGRERYSKQNCFSKRRELELQLSQRVLPQKLRRFSLRWVQGAMICGLRNQVWQQRRKRRSHRRCKQNMKQFDSSAPYVSLQ